MSSKKKRTYAKGWQFDKINDNKLIEYSKEVRMLMRDVRLTNLGI